MDSVPGEPCYYVGKSKANVHCFVYLRSGTDSSCYGGSCGAADVAVARICSAICRSNAAMRQCGSNCDSQKGGSVTPKPPLVHEGGILEEHIKIAYTSTGKQKADILTKGLAKGLHQKAIREIVLKDSSVTAGVLTHMLDHRMLCREDGVVGAIEDKGYSILALDQEIGQDQRVKRSSQTPCCMSSASESDLEQDKQVQRSSQIQDPIFPPSDTEQEIGQPERVQRSSQIQHPSESVVEIDQVSESVSVPFVVGKPYRDESWSLGETVLSHELSGFGVSCRSSEDSSLQAFRREGPASGVPFGMGNPNDSGESNPEKTVLSHELFDSGAICLVKDSCHRAFSHGLWGQTS